MCEHELAIRAAVAAGHLTPTDEPALAAHVERCETCAAAALETALTRVGLGTPAEPDDAADELRVALAAAGLETPAERRALERHTRRHPADDALRVALRPPLAEDEMSTETGIQRRTEQSVLISLDTLERTPLGPRVAPRTPREHGSGLIELSALGLGPSSPAAGAGGTQATAPAPAPVPGLAVAMPRHQRSGVLPYVVAVWATLAAVAAGVYVYSHRSTPETSEATRNAVETSVVVAAVEPAPAVLPAPTAPATRAVLVAADRSPAAATEPASSLAAARGGGARKPAGTDVAAAPRPAAPRDDDAPRAGAASPPAPVSVAAAPPPAPKKGGGDEVDDLLGGLSGGPRPARRPAGGGPATPAADPLLPEQLTKAQILSVVKARTAAINACKDRQPDATGTVMVSLKIERSGRVGSATARPPFVGTPLGTCVESAVRQFQFPQFSGDSMSLNMPFAL